MPSLRLIGYWRSEFEDVPWPDPRDLIDERWPAGQRDMLISHLVRGRTLEQYRGLSPCRLCGQYVGSKELTDGTYCWPEGLAHYLAVHHVRLPDEFVAHVEQSPRDGETLATPEFDHLGQRLRGSGYDDEYQAHVAATAERVRAGEPPDALSANWLHANITIDWWLGQSGCTRPEGQ